MRRNDLRIHRRAAKAQRIAEVHIGGSTEPGAQRGDIQSPQPPAPAEVVAPSPPVTGDDGGDDGDDRNAGNLDEDEDDSDDDG